MDSERPSATSLELTLDPASEARIRDEWRALADAGLSSLAGHTSPSNRPHITLMVRPTMPPVTRERLSTVVSLPMPVTIGDPILFGTGDRRVLARLVVPSAAMLALHHALHTVLGAPGGGSGADSPFTRADQWVPHIALARRLRIDTLPQALRALDDVHPAAPAAGSTAIALRRWDANSATITDLLD
jgi:hypothetical protein